VSVTVPINPEVLRWARESVEISVGEAAARIKEEESVILAWEAGTSQPTIGPLRELSEFYRRPLAAFLLAKLPKDPPAPADFRVMKGGSQHFLSRDTRHALNRAFELRAIAADLERQESGRATSGAKVLDDRKTPFAEAAAAVRKDLGIGFEEQRSWKRSPNRALNAWRRALERRGVLVFAMTMPIKEVRGFSISGSGGPPVIVLNSGDTEHGRIFTLMHEYAHVLMGTGGICLPSTAPERHSLEGRELYCNRFAGAVLVPEDLLRAMPEALKLGTSEIIPTDNAIATVSNVFGVSKQVFWYRMRDTGLISKQRFAAKWPLWRQHKPKKRAKRTGGPPASVRVLSSRGLRFTGLVLEANNESLLSTNETLDYLAIQLKDLESVEQEARHRNAE
jgi:Zn-dependent peptidase ImmA (M78 family)/transcriptional regulator with XRE-family HTH domain